MPSSILSHILSNLFHLSQVCLLHSPRRLASGEGIVVLGITLCV